MRTSVTLRKASGFETMYMSLSRRCVPTASLFYVSPHLLGPGVERTFGDECHSLTPYALKRVSLYFVLLWYIENSLFYQISVEMSFTAGLGVGYKD